MFKFISKYFDFNEKELERFRKKVQEINKLEDKARDLKDEQFPKETEKLKKELSEGKTLNDILPWAYALVREAARRTLGQRHFDVQLIAAIGLHENKIAEQKTGEGKTLSATPALYLNALTGKGVHLVTVNDYLARRDSGWMGNVFHFLGLKTSAIIGDKSFIFDPEYIDKEAGDPRLQHLKETDRKEAYVADITYGINSEFGFDYLRDNMAQSPADFKQRAFYFAIIDEADSVLIDEARTPHIISQQYDEDTSKYYNYAKLVKQLEEKEDYTIDEKLRTAHLTEIGIQKIEKVMKVDNIYEKDFDTLFHIEAALKAATLFKNDKEYIVRDGEVIIVDEFTGRLLPGRRFSEGLHQAIEAKENVQIQRESKTLATVSLQNYFRMYEKLAGMTGTAATEAEEFNKIYKTDVITVPTHRTMVRKDHPDMIYKTERAKYNAVVEEIAKIYKTGRPVLVGTTSIDKNELLSRLLHQKKIPHELLNAKNHEREAAIIAQAGIKGAVTVATNMAGRGVDIILGGQQPDKNSYLKKDGSVDETKYNKNLTTWQKNHDEVVEAGGLYVIGTERHESRRIDNQLRGRAGRQGDPGDTIFFVSLEDEMMRIFGGEQIIKIMNTLNFPEDQPLSHGLVSKALEQAQIKVEGFNFDTRKHLVDYDDVLNKQRQIVYDLRRKMINLDENKKDEYRDTVFEVFEEEINQMIANYSAIKDSITDTEIESLVADIETLVPFNKETLKNYFIKKDFEGLGDYLLEEMGAMFARREKELGEGMWFSIVRSIFLSTIDQYWTDHLTAIEDLREGINLRGYAQLNPLIEYKNEAYTMFEKMISDVNFEATRRIFRVQVNVTPQLAEEKKDEKQMVFKSASAVDPFNSAETQAKPLANAQAEAKRNTEQSIEEAQEATIKNREYSETLGGEFGIKIRAPGAKNTHNLGRNDPCWCGSGKKYKRCHYPN